MAQKNSVSSASAALTIHDEDLLGYCRTQWYAGDWESLTKIDRTRLRQHPDRAKLAIYLAAGHAQCGNLENARLLTTQAKKWGCEKELIAQVMIAGARNNLCRAAVLMEENSVNPITPNNYSGLSNVGIQKKLKAEIKAEIIADLRARTTNPYAHNRTLTLPLNRTLCQFAEKNLRFEKLKSYYVDYLAVKSIQIERNCVGRLATTIQDIIARQLVAECVHGDRICILEIGALYGVSLAILYNHVVTRFATAKVVALDPFDGYYGQALDVLLNQPVNEQAFIRNMRLSNIPESDYSLIKQYSTNQGALSSARELSINLLVIDGDHSYEGIKYDFDTYFPLLQPGGYVIFDDYNAEEWPGVQKFIDEDVCKKNDFEYLGFISRTAVGRKAK